MKFKYAHIVAPSLVAVMLVSLFAAAVSADGGMSGQEGTGMAEQNGDSMGMNGHMWNWTEENMWKDGMGFINGNGQDMQEMMQEGMKYCLFDQFSYADGVADGYFVTFHLNETTGAITNYSLKTEDGPVKVFESIEIAAFDPSAPEVHGAVMLLGNETVQVIVHDNPTGMYHVVANDTPTNVSFKVADGMSITQISPGLGDGPYGERQAVMISDGLVEGVITTDDGTLVVETGASGTYVNVTFVNDHAMFRAKPTFAHRHMQNEQAMLEAIIQSRMACEISLIVRNGSAMYDIMEYQHQFRMTVMQAERNRITIQVSSENHEGKVVLMNMDQLTMETKKGQVSVELDGAIVKETTNPLEVFYASGSDAGDALYTVLQSDDTSQILVYVPTFSVHSLSIESVLPGAEIFGISGLIAVVGAVAVVGVAAITLFKRKG